MIWMVVGISTWWWRQRPARLERHKSKNGEIERRRRGVEASMRGRDRGNEAEDRDVDPRGQEPRDLGQVRLADGQAQGSRSLHAAKMKGQRIKAFLQVLKYSTGGVLEIFELQVNIRLYMLMMRDVIWLSDVCLNSHTRLPWLALSLYILQPHTVSSTL